MTSPEQTSRNNMSEFQGNNAKRRRLGRSFGSRNTGWTPPFATPPSTRNSGGPLSQGPDGVQNSSPTANRNVTTTTSSSTSMENGAGGRSNSDFKAGSSGDTDSHTNSELTRSSCTPKSSQLRSRGGLSSRKQFRGDFKSPMRDRAEKKEAETPESIQKENESLRSRLSELDEDVANLKREGCSEEELQVHIKKMHEYNELKDVTQMLLGRIAILEGITTRQLHDEMGLGEDD